MGKVIVRMTNEIRDVFIADVVDNNVSGILNPRSINDLRGSSN